MSSCATNKTTADAGELPGPVTAEIAEIEPVPELAAPDPAVELPRPEDGFRMSGILDLPSDGEFRSAQSAIGKPGASASPVISRPPTDPPSRIKPKLEEPE